jgi:hypothetical protein
VAGTYRAATHSGARSGSSVSMLRCSATATFGLPGVPPRLLPAALEVVFELLDALVLSGGPKRDRDVCGEHAADATTLVVERAGVL